MARPKIDILLVEDDDADAIRVEVMLRRAEDVSFQVQRAVSLKAALTVMEIRRPHLVLLDLSLSDYQGYDTAVEFARSTDVPFVVLTGNDDLHMAMRCTSLGAQDYVLKSDVQAKPLERTLIMAIKRAANAAAEREMELASRDIVLEDEDKATVSILRPRISRLVEAVEDLEAYIRRNAPRLSDDVEAIFAKHDVDVTIKSLRDTLRIHADREAAQPRKRRISDQALDSVDMVIEKRGGVAFGDAAEAEHNLLDIIHRRDAR